MRPYITAFSGVKKQLAPGMLTHYNFAMSPPLWSLLPFAGVVLCVGVLPSLAPTFWKKYQLLLLSALSMPILSMSAALNYHWVVTAFVDYVSFVCLLGALYAIGGGLYVQGTPKANPVTNLGYMALGACLANFIGTLGASMLLIRPLLRSNRGRKHEAHVIIFFIFIVSNAGGLLTPLGDPPLLFGYLLGVPFWWTMRLFSIWFFVIISLLGIFSALDSYFYLNDPDFRGPMKQEIKSRFHILGRWNFLLIPVVIAAMVLPRYIPAEFELWQVAARVATLLFVIFLSRKITHPQVAALNNFTWEPFYEVALIFAGVFSTMIPALRYIEAHASSLGITTPWSFYWLTGAISALLDNAPTYASSFALAQGLGKDFAMINLENAKTISEPLLMALSCGAVFFGAMTYIGNGPNLLVKAVAEDEKIKMPGFFTYILWSICFLLPVLFLTGILYFE